MSRWPSWAVRPNEPSGFRGRKAIIIEPCSRISLSLSVICKPTSEDIKQHNRTIWMAWSGFGQKRIWSRSKPVCKNHRVRFWQNATGPLPVSHFQTRLRSTTDGLDHNYCAKPARIRLGSGCLCQVWARRIRSGNKPVSNNHPARFWQKLRCRSGSDANRIRMFY